ncbi:hypothetical protein C1646_665177 [Rhizophagus diaphanus]|nr:hypothetical protein C1646_665177 [Rhizophagus diaphanus] [Rhizophagus sp. MUCL 43196]
MNLIQAVLGESHCEDCYGRTFGYVEFWAGCLVPTSKFSKLYSYYTLYGFGFGSMDSNFKISVGFLGFGLSVILVKRKMIRDDLLDWLKNRSVIVLMRSNCI